MYIESFSCSIVTEAPYAKIFNNIGRFRELMQIQLLDTMSMPYAEPGYIALEER